MGQTAWGNAGHLPWGRPLGSGCTRDELSASCIRQKRKKNAPQISRLLHRIDALVTRQDAIGEVLLLGVDELGYLVRVLARSERHNVQLEEGGDLFDELATVRSDFREERRLVLVQLKDVGILKRAPLLFKR